MPEPSRRGRRKWTLLFWAAAFLLLLACTLPLQVEHIFLPPLLDSAGLTGYRVAVSRFGPLGCTLHLAGAPDDALLRSGTLELDWTIAGLLQGRLQRLSGDGLLLNPAPPLPLPSSNQQSAPDSAAGLPLLIERIVLRNSFIALPGNDGSLLLPLSLSGEQQGEKSGTAARRYRVSLRVAGHELQADFSLDQEGIFAGKGQADLDMPELAAVLKDNVQGRFLGSTRISVEFAGGLNPLRLEKINGNALFTDFQAQWDKAILRAAGENDARLFLSGGKGTYRINGSGFTLHGPLTCDLAFSAEISPERGALGWEGDITLQPAAGQQIADQWRLEEGPALRLQHAGKSKAGLIEINLQTGLPEDGASHPYLFRLADKTFQADKLAAEARMLVSPRDTDRQLTAAFTLSAELAGGFGNGRIRLPSLALRVEAAVPGRSSDQQVQIHGRLALGDGSLDLANPDLHLRAMSLALPFSWPGQADEGEGEVLIRDISLGQIGVGGFRASITRKENSFSLQGEARTPFLPEKTISVAAAVHPLHAGGIRGEVSWSAARAQLAVHELAALHPVLKSLTGSALIDLAGHLQFDRCGLRGDLATSLEEGRFSLPEANLQLDDVSFNLRLPRLPQLESASAQHLAIGSFRSRKVAVTDFTTSFRVESPESLFIEEISARWSGGRVFSSGLRLHRDLAELDLALICDHLQLSGMLTQLGLADADGDGSVSGRIPLVYKDGMIQVDDGFLFTAPGDKGDLRITRSPHLNVGLPLDTPQLSPLNFAGAALGDFEYNWAKLHILSEEENLLLKLQIDGKPRKPLPYRFDARNSVFVRLAEGSPGGIDQPVKLDVNFKVPVNELIRNQQILLPLLRNLK